MEPFLKKEDVQFYQDNGYLIIKKNTNVENIETLKTQTENIIENFNPQQLKIFTTEDQQNHIDTYFLESGDKVCCFFEEKAISENGEMLVPKELAINKVGHAMHDLIPAIEKIVYSKQLLSICNSLGLRNPSIVQSQYIFKQPNIGAKVNPHTDSTFIYTEPLSCIGAWIALEDATIENGCLRAIPGSHKLPLKERFICNEERTRTKFESVYTNNIKWDLSKMEALEVEKGDMIILHGQLVHASYANRSPKSRHAFVLHMIDLDCKWPLNNWLRRSDKLPFRSMENVVYRLFG